MFDDIGEISLLYDFYGELLSQKQKEFLELYNEENYSLAEIAEEYGLTRQAVYDAVKKAQKSLDAYEKKLGLVARFRETERVLAEINAGLDALADEYKDNEDLAEKLRAIRAEADRLGE